MADFQEIKEETTRKLFKDYPTMTIKIIIIVWALFVIFLALYLENKWLLALLAAWEILP